MTEFEGVTIENQCEDFNAKDQHNDVCNGNSTKRTSENEKSVDSDKTDHDMHNVCVKLTQVLTSRREFATYNVESTVSDVDHVIAHTALNGDNMRGKVDGTVNDLTVAAATQAEGNDGEEANTIETKKAIAMNNEIQDDSSDNNNELLSKTRTNNDEEKPCLLEEDAETDHDVTTSTGDAENIILELNEKLACSNKVLETVESNIERKRSSTIPAKRQEENDSYSHPRPRKQASTISFKVEATTPISEASLEIEPVEVVVSSCSTSPISELEEDSEVAVIVNPETDQVSYTLTRKRVRSGLDSLTIKSANSAVKRSVASVETADLDDAIGDENVSPVPHVSTLNRYRNTFSWKRGRSITRQSFAAKSSDNFLSFHNISYTVQQKKIFRVLGSKVILNNISGIMHAGINAIMGPSGCGKTSLLDIISGRKEKKGVTGSIIINGELIPENFRCASGYVTQEERVTGTLTVKENIMFSAQLRLPRDMTYDEKQEIVEEVISDLGLQGCAHSRVGSEKQQGVSGGERKRTAIGMELIVSPGVLFLDEPTSGLDSTTAISVMNILHALSTQGRVIILSIHQPRYSILKLFDTMTLLSRGEMIYHGSVRSALPFFTEVLGVTHEKYNNPADFFIDVIIRNEKSMDGSDASEENIIQMKKIEEENTVNEYAKGYVTSEEYRCLQQVLNPISDTARNNLVGSAPNYANNLFWQVWHLSIRTFKTIVRDLNGAFTTIMAIIALGIFSGIIFFQLETTLQGQRDRVGAIFFNMVCNILPGLAGMEALVAERALFVHENANGFYNTGAYFLAKIIMDIIPFRILTVFLYCPIAYFITGLRSGADRFFFYTLTMMVLSFAAASQVFTFSAVIGVYKVANPLLLMVIAISMVFSGFFITLGNIGVWLRWLQYLSIYRYAFHAFMWNEFEGTVFCNRNTDPLDANVSGVVEAFDCVQNIPANLNCDLNFTMCGDVLLGRYQFDAFDVWWNIFILIAIAITTLVIGFIGLLSVTKRK